MWNVVDFQRNFDRGGGKTTGRPSKEREGLSTVLRVGVLGKSFSSLVRGKRGGDSFWREEKKTLYEENPDTLRKRHQRIRGEGKGKFSVAQGAGDTSTPKKEEESRRGRGTFSWAPRGGKVLPQGEVGKKRTPTSREEEETRSA